MSKYMRLISCSSMFGKGGKVQVKNNIVWVKSLFLHTRIIENMERPGDEDSHDTRKLCLTTITHSILHLGSPSSVDEML